MIADLASEHAERLDAHAPGLLIGLHVTGSPLLDDYVPGVSDLDLVGVLSREPTSTDLAALAEVHVGSNADAVYLRPDDLTGPAVELVRPWGRDGVLNTTSPANITPVLWDQLNRYSLTVRGERPNTPVTASEVAAYCRENLDSYWRRLVGEMGAAQDQGIVLPTEFTLWVGTGPVRLWHTIRTGDIVGKTQAVAAAAEHWPDLAEPLSALAEARRGERELGAEHGIAVFELGRRILAEA